MSVIIRMLIFWVLIGINYHLCAQAFPKGEGLGLCRINCPFRSLLGTETWFSYTPNYEELRCQKGSDARQQQQVCRVVYVKTPFQRPAALAIVEPDENI